MPISDEAAVEAAAVALIEAFAANDRDGYFGAFVPDASFVFPTIGRVLVSRDDYATEWQLWIDTDDFKVLECSSFDRVIQVYGDMAIFIHRTVTRVTGRSGETRLDERETIIFRKTGGKWLAVHEHLSPLPE